eukprot:6210656-Pleurochrysis_carterae.AAC.2
MLIAFSLFSSATAAWWYSPNNASWASEHAQPPPPKWSRYPTGFGVHTSEKGVKLLSSTDSSAEVRILFDGIVRGARESWLAACECARVRPRGRECARGCARKHAPMRKRKRACARVCARECERERTRRCARARALLHVRADEGLVRAKLGANAQPTAAMAKEAAEAVKA